MTIRARLTSGLVLALLVVPPSLQADVPQLAIVKNRKYVMRTAFGPVARMVFYASGGNGVWSWEPDGTLQRLWPLVWGKAAASDEAGITATEDTVVVQGSTFLEFDAATYRLLRRYPALDSHLHGWGFKGPYVTRAVARELSIEPGYYGFAFCPPGVGIVPETCGPSDFPGWPAARGGMSNRLYHRHAETPSLTSIKVLETGPYNLPDSERRYITLDASRKRFWTGLAYITGSTLGYLPITSDGIQDEVRAPVHWGASQASAIGLFYDRTNDTLLTPWLLEGEPDYVTRRSATLTQPEERIYTAADPVWGLPMAFATLAPEVPEHFQQMVPVIGKGPGAHGTNWSSDVWIFNPSNEPSSIRVRRVARPAVEREFTLPPFGCVELIDTLGTLGGGPLAEGGDGVTNDALVITSPYRWGAQLTVYSRTYTRSANGTYGQAVPAVPTRLGYSTHTYDAGIAWDTDSNAPEFYLDLREPGRFRHNLGVVNDEASPLDIRLYYGVATGPRPGQESPTETITIPPHTVANISLEALLRPETRMNDPSMVKIGGSRPAPLWLAIVDNLTGDSTFLPYATFGFLGAYDSTIAVPQIARTPGAHGTFWRSDLYGFFHPPATEYDQLPRATFYPNDPARCGGRSSVATTLVGPSGQPGVSVNHSSPSIYRRVFPDVVSQFTECNEGTMGALEMNLGSWMAGFTRTYTTTEGGGTYGDILPFYPSGGWPAQHFTGLRLDDAFRTNVGMYNGLDYPVVHRLVLYNHAGNEVSRTEHTIAPRRSVQAPLSAFTGQIPNGVYSLSVVPLDQPGRAGRSWAYVAVVDNKSGDTTNFW